MMRKSFLALAAVMLAVSVTSAQIPYSGSGTYSENFNSLASAPGTFPWINGATVNGWFAADAFGAITQYRADNGSSTAGDLYSYGTNGDPDRALGSGASNATGTLYFGVAFKNNSPGMWTYTSFTFEFFWEQWRDASEDQWVHDLEYQIFQGGGGSINAAGGWNSLASLPNIQNTNAGALDGNDLANRVFYSFTVNGISWAPGDELWIRWVDYNDPGSDHGMGVDDFRFAAVPEPTTFALVGLGMGAAGLVTRRLRRKKADQAVVA